MIMLKLLGNKRLLLVYVLISIVLIQTMEAQNSSFADSLIASGNQHYMNREYNKAVDSYMRVIGMRYEAAPLFYNLGNAYYKQNNLPRAILYYEKARLLAPWDEDIRQNLAIANSRIVDKIDSIPEFFLRRWINGLAGSLAPDQWAMVSIILFALSLGALYLYIAGSRYGIKKLGFTMAVFLLIFSLTSFMFMRNRKQSIRYSQGAIVMVPVVSVKSSPDEQGTNVFLLHEGTRVVTVDSVQQWKEVRISDGNKGWVPDSVLAGI
jgi:tetratricopeptide (TPR) repeat protein